ncbi:cation channel family protein (macronuclear) [Tetrahymena thermophila SB210]|uniref:Cation channel family protein n=1 Tax=Tetrahymena thermophila (strain SB210) TaxID=312017 RepID=I7LWB9_TETTS|nr:cation channel family protein [Tetrahymena thermophila SB210]EAS01339.2 cation channel family protein [Tetrahymena thermophila SB210]|eukprot:XP_001021584.2 cation channel family protein [Tetrahymena thermophila SB210]
MNYNQKDLQYNTPNLNTEFDQNEDKILLTSNSKRQLFKDESNQQPVTKQNLFQQRSSQKEIHIDQQLSYENNQIKIQNNSCDEKNRQLSYSSKDGQNLNDNYQRTKKVTVSPQLDGIQKISDNKNPFGWLNLKKRIDSLKYMVRRLELSSLLQIRSKLRNYHLMIIDDKSSNRQYDEKQTKFFEDLVSLDYFLANLSQVFYTVFRFFPSTTNTKILIIVFKIILALQLTYQLFMLPFLISFPYNSINLFSVNEKMLRAIFVIPFILEMILNFNLKYFEHGELISDKYTIILRYIKKDFWWDAIGIAGTGLIDENSYVAFILIIFFIRFIKFKSMYNSIEEKFQLSLRFPVSFTITNLILAITILAHVFGCIFQYIGLKVHDSGNVSWLDKAELIDKGILDRYIASLYFSFITMISVGYGDITPINNIERIFVTCMTVFSCGTFAYVVNIIGSLFQQLQINEAEYRQQRYEMSNYMKNRNIDSELQTKVFQYLEMLKLKKEWEPESGQNVIEIMNPKLKESIYKDYYGRYLKSCKLFSSKFSTQFLDMLSVACKEQVFGPGEIIFYQKEQQINFHEEEQNKLNDQYQNIYLVIKGKVLLFQDNGISRLTKKTFINTKTKYSVGECFAVKEFLCGVPYEFTAQSKGLTTVLKIQRSHFLEVLKRFPKDYEVYCALRDELVFYEQDKYIKCQPCSRYDHSTYACPRMHFLKQKQKAILKYSHSLAQERSFYRRSNRKKLNPLGQSQYQIKKDLKEYRVHLVVSTKMLQQNMQKELQNKFVLIESNNILKKQSQLESPQFQALNNNPADCESINEEEAYKLREYGSIQKTQVQTNKSRQFTQETLQLMEITQENDEYFYLKCPIVAWNQQLNMYETSAEQDEYEGSIAIQCYLEQNYDITTTLDNLNILDLFEEIQNEEEEEIYEKNIQNKSLDHLTDLLIPPPINNNQNLNKNSLKSITEEDNLIQMSDTSLSCLDQQDQANVLDNNNNLIKVKQPQEKEKPFQLKPLEKKSNFASNLSKEESIQAGIIKQQDIHLNIIGSNNDIEPTQKTQQEIGDLIQKKEYKQQIQSPDKVGIKRRSKHLMSFKQLKSILSISMDIQSQKNKTPRASKLMTDMENIIQVQEQINENSNNNSNNKNFKQEFSNLQEISKEDQKSNSQISLINPEKLNSSNNSQQVSKQNMRNQTYLNKQAVQQKHLKNQNPQKVPYNNGDIYFSPIINSQSQAQKLNSIQDLSLAFANNQAQQQLLQPQQHQSNQVSQLIPENVTVMTPQLQNKHIQDMLTFIFSFEIPQSFQKYFPLGNLENIIKKYIKYQDQFTIKFINNNKIINQKSVKYMSLTPQAKQQKSINIKREPSRFSKK